jgi:tetratricopeptide (TPR) repeat protein
MLVSSQPLPAPSLAFTVEQINAALKRGDGGKALEPLRRLLREIEADNPVRPALEHNLLGALKMQATNLLAAGRTEAALELAREALAGAKPSAGLDVSFLRPRAEALRDLASELTHAHQLPEAVALMRAAIAVYPCPTFQIDLTNLLALTRQPGLLTDFCDTLGPEALGRHLFIACFPKSGSSFLRNVLLHLTGFRDTYLFYAGAPNEHDLYLPSLLEFATVNTITQQHARASEGNVQLMQGFGITPVVLVRNIFDALVSLDDFYHSGASFSTFFFSDYLQLTPEQRLELLIDHVAPWYMQFYASWLRVERDQRLRVHWLTYEELIADKPAAFRRILDFWGIGVDEERLRAALAAAEGEKKRNRFNQGVTGRGAKRFTPAQVEKIIGLTAYFPLLSFERIGIPVIASQVQ